MPFLDSGETAQLILSIVRRWYGCPILQWQGRLLDGAKRLQAWRALHMPGNPPCYLARDVWDAGRFLLLVGHVQRASDLLQCDDLPADLLAVRLRLPPARVIPLLAVQYRDRKQRPRRKAPRRRAEVVTAVRLLYLDAIETGREITARDLGEALGTWL